MMINKKLAIGAAVFLGLLGFSSRGHPVATIALREARRWKGVKEDTPRGKAMLAEYWRGGAKIDPSYTAPWSGAFIAWAANQAIPGSLMHTGAHSDYVRRAMSVEPPGPPGQYRFLPGNFPVKVGDIIVKFRGSQPKGLSRVRSGEFVESHGDIVVKIEGGKAIAIGGNKANDVSSQAYSLNQDGSVAGKYGVYAVLRLGRDIS